MKKTFAAIAAVLTLSSFSVCSLADSSAADTTASSISDTDAQSYSDSADASTDTSSTNFLDSSSDSSPENSSGVISFDSSEASNSSDSSETSSADDSSEPDQTEKFTVTFDPCGGFVTSRAKTVKVGSLYGNLPSVRKKGSTFRGWYTSPTGGKRVYTTTPVDPNVKTLYARYTQASFSTLRFAFENSYYGLGVGYSYRIPRKRYDEMFDKSYADYVYGEVGRSWAGNCFGMSAASALFNAGTVKIQSFNKNEYFVKELRLDNKSTAFGMDLFEFIECMQLSQYSTRVQTAYYANLNDYRGMAARVKKCEAQKGSPVVISVMNETFGHAVVGYRFRTISAQKDRIYVYDCNYPNGAGKYITLYKRNGSYYKSNYEGYRSAAWFDLNDIWDAYKNRGKPQFSDFGSVSSGKLFSSER